MNRHVLPSLASTMMTLGLCTAPTQASVYGAYSSRTYARQSTQTLELADRKNLVVTKRAPAQRRPSAVLAGELHTQPHNTDDVVLGVKRGRASDLIQASHALADVKESELALSVPSATSLVIIDEAVTNKQALLHGLKPGAAVAYISSGKDGLLQLKNILSEFSNLDSLHIVSHAEDGVLLLGNSHITEEVLQQEVTALSAIDDALKDGADVMLYGCNLAASQKGEQLLELVAREGNVDVAASDNVTSGHSLKGDWELEVRKGSVDAELAFTERALKQYDDILAINDSGGRTIIGDGFGPGFEATKSYDVDGSGHVFRLSTNSNDGQSLYHIGGYVYANLTGSIVGLSSVTADFTGGDTFDIDSVDLYVTATANYVFTPSAGSPLTLSVTSGGFDTQILNFTNITSFTITRQDGNDIDPMVLDNFVIKNATVPVTIPTITSATYNANTNQLVVTGTDFEANAGASNDVDVSALTIRGAANGTRSLATSSDVEIDSSTQFTVTLSGADIAAVEALLDKNGTASDDFVTYNLAAADDFIANLTAGDSADATNGITVSNVLDSDGSLTAAGGVAEPVGLGTTITNTGSAVNVFDFTLSDGGGADASSLDVSQVVLNVSGTTTDADRAKVTWRLAGPDSSNVVGTYNSGSDTITFSGLSISVASGGSEVYTVNAFYNDNTGITEDTTYLLSVDGDTDLTVSGSGTQMGSTSAVTNGAGGTLDVVATALAFTTQPATSVSGAALATQPVVTAQDAAGNTDVDFTETVTLTEASAGALSNTSVAAVSGVATFTSVTYTATADQQTFTLTADDQSGVGSDLSTVDANSVTSDVVATQLTYSTQPAPLSVVNGVATSFTTVPVVVAQDGAGVTDTGYSTDITFSEINGAGSALLSASGDTDGDSSTVSLTPSSGVVTASGMQITYTASGGSSENFNLRAASGGLTAVNSNQLTGVVPDNDGSVSAGSGVSEPVVLDTTVSSVGAAVDVFDFEISDAGTADAIALDISQIRINTSGTLDPSKVTFRLNGPDVSNVTGSYSSNVITFTGLSISVANGASETYTLNAYYDDNTGLTEGQTLVLSLDGDTDFTVSSTGTQMGSTSALTNGAGTSVNVVATALAFSTQPAGAVSGQALTTQPVVTARDAVGNIDVDFTETITLTENGAGSITGDSVAAVSGVATFSSLAYTATSDQESFTLTANDQDGVGSNLSTVNANSVTADVVATSLVFATLPAGSVSGSALTTQPVVQAIDPDGNVDTGFSETITLTENGSGSLTGGAVAAVSGVATFTAVNYTATTDQESFTMTANDQDGIGSNLDPINANAITSDVVATELAFTTQPAGSVSGEALTTQPVVSARDANGVIDTGFTETITLTENGAGSITGDSVAAVSGVATFSSVAYTATSDQESFTLTANDQDGVDSNLPTVNANTITSDVVATQLTFSTQPAGSVSGSDLTTQPVVTATDGNGITDTGFAETISLTEASAGALTGGSVTAVSGVATFTGVNYTATADQQSFTLTADDQGGVGSDLASVSANSVTSDVVATQLAFDVQPAALTLYNNQAYSFTTVPVISARDDNNTLDTGYSGGVILTEVSGAGSATFTAIGDTDGSSASVTLTPSAGLASFTGLQVTYSNAGDNTETFNLQAASGSLTSVSSSQLTAIAGDVDASLTAAAGVVEPVALPFSADSVGEAVNLFDFSLVDGGGGDSLALDVSEVRINVSGTASASDVAKVSWRLNGNDANNVVGTYNSGVITFTGLTLSVADGNAETYTVNGYFNDASGLTHGTVIVLSVDGDTDLTVSSSGSKMASTSAITNGTGTVISDDIGPAVTSVSVPANATYVESEALDFTVNFDESVTVNTASGTPRLQLTMGTETRYATYLSGTGSSALLFRYTVQAGDNDTDGIVLSTTLDDNLATLQDAQGNNALVNLGTVASLAAVLVDTQAPTIAEITAVALLGNDSTPDVSFNSDESGTLSVGGRCGSSAEGAVSAGTQTITLTQPDNSSALDEGSYSDCTLVVVDSAGNTSNTVTLTAFTLDVSGPSLTTNTGGALSEGDSTIVSNAALAASDNTSAASNVTFTLVSAPANGTLFNNASSLASGNRFTQADIDAELVSYEHDGGETTSDTFTFALSDSLANINDNGGGNFSFGLTVDTVNDAPSTTADVEVTNEDNTVMVDVLANDADSDNAINPASVTVVTAPSNGSTSVNTANGVITYTPNENFEGSDSFTYTVEDVSGALSEIAAVSITVIAQNDVPVAAADLVDTNMNTLVSIDVAANDTDVDSGDAPDSTTLVIVSAASNGTAVVNAGQIDYTPATDFAGTDTFTYTIDDTAGATSNVATVTINVIDPNVLPTAANDSASTDEDNAVSVSVLVNDSDTDGTLVVSSVAIMAIPSNGSTSVNATDGVITYTPTTNFNGTDTFTYTVQDDAGGTSNAATVTITVNSVNDLPVANDDVVVLQEDNSLSINVLGNDTDIDGTLNSASVAVITSPTQGSVVVNSTTGAITYTPADNYAGSDSFTYQVMDDAGATSNVATVALTVDAVNDVPMANDDSAEVLTQESVDINVLDNDTDIDGSLDASSITIVSSPSLGSVINNAGTLTYTPTAATSATDSFTYTVEDDAGATSNTATVTIDVTAPTPIALSGTPSGTAVEGEAYRFAPQANVFDGLSAAFSIENAPTWAAFDTQTGELTGVPIAAHVGVTTGIVISVTDGYTTASLDAFSITVSAGIDTDGDTISDYQEGVDDTDPNNALEYYDMTAPDILVPDNIILDASGLITRVSLAELLGLSVTADAEEVQGVLDLIAMDNVDGAGCCNPTVTGMENGVLLLKPGLHLVEWVAEDFMGNRTSMSQEVHLRPLVSFGKDKTTVEGRIVNVKVVLNGPAPSYPLTVPYRVNTTASTTDNTEVDGVVTSSDHGASHGTVVFEEGQTSVNIPVEIVEDTSSEPDEVLVMMLDDRTTNEQDLANGFDADIHDINSGSKNTYSLTIVERNIAPVVAMVGQQDGRQTVRVAQNSGDFVLTANVIDENVSDTHRYDWSLSDNSLMDGDAMDSTFTIDPSGLAAGGYRLNVLVTDSAGATGSANLHFVVVPALPQLLPTNDTDRDGVDDETEGTADSDNDGISDYLDNITALNVLPEVIGVSDSFLIECDPGVRCRLGEFALLNEVGGARITDSDIDLLENISEDLEFRPVGGIFDFEIHDLETLGQEVRVVVPQVMPIPKEAVYRKFQDGTWRDYTVDDKNLIHSSAGSLGFCPPPGDNRWEPGLVEGYFCVQLTIEDGGPNDADGEVNATVSDPGVVSQRRISTTSIQTRSGGGSIDLVSMFILLMLGAMMVERASRIRLTHTLLAVKRNQINRMSRYVPMLFLGGVMVANPTNVQADSNGFSWKGILSKSALEASAFSVSGSRSQGDFDRGLQSAGFDASIRSYDTSALAVRLAYSYEFSASHFAVFTYSDLGNAQADFSVDLFDGVNDELELAQALEAHHPISASGYTLGYRYQHQWLKNMAAYVEAGVFIWTAELGSNVEEVSPGDQSGTDPAFSVGGVYSINNELGISVNYLHHILDDQTVNGFGVGMQFSF